MPADVQVFVTPSYILRNVSWTEGPLSYEAEHRLLTYRRTRVLEDQTVQLVFPLVQDGYAVSVEVVEGRRHGDVELRDAIYLPAVAMFKEFSADVTFDPTANAAPPLLPRTTVRLRVTVRPIDRE